MVNAGRILILAQGEWDNLTNYVPLDLVSKGETAYLARKASVGVDPETDVEMFYWQPFGSVAKIATTEIPGLVMPDGTTLTIDSTGLLKAEIGVSKLTDVLITNLANDSFLKYDATSQKWKNATLGTASSKNSTNAVTQGSSDLVESGAVYTKYDELRTDGAKAYKTDDATETAIASDDLLPFYDTSASAKKKMTVANLFGKSTSNQNLLDNGWFTINQRGKSSYSGNSYSLDRWMTQYYGATENEEIEITNNGIIGKNSWDINQFLPLWNELKGRTVTISALIEGVVYSKTIIIPIDGTTEWQGVTTVGPEGVSMDLYVHPYFVAQNLIVFRLRKIGTITKAIKAVKLEIGSVSTLAMDTVPNYAEELLKCQRYYQRITTRSGIIFGLAMAVSETLAVMQYKLSTNMRTHPVLQEEATGFVLNTADNSETHAVSGIQCYFQNDVVNGVLVFTSSGLTAGNIYKIDCLNNTDVVGFTADFFS